VSPDTLKTVVRHAFMNGLGWMEGNRDSSPSDWREAADWFVTHWESSEHNPLNYPPPIPDCGEAGHPFACGNAGCMEPPTGKEKE
jgi:hypothetical protein